jgi:hypothetical protein
LGDDQNEIREEQHTQAMHCEQYEATPVQTGPHRRPRRSWRSQKLNIGQPSKVTDHVAHDGGREVAGAHEEHGCNHAEDGRVGHLDGHGEQGTAHRLALTNLIDSVVNVRNAKPESGHTCDEQVLRERSFSRVVHMHSRRAEEHRHSGSSKDHLLRDRREDQVAKDDQGRLGEIQQTAQSDKRRV